MLRRSTLRFSALNCIKLQRRPFEFPSASRITIRLALKIGGKTYDLLASSNANRLTIQLADGCFEAPRCVFNSLNCEKFQCGPSEHPSASRITIRLALELVGKSYDLRASSNASRITKRLVDGCSEGPHCVFSALNYVKLKRGSFEHTSASRISIRLALELAGKTYDLPASSNANRLTIRLADGCSEVPRCVFSALNYVKSQRGSSKHSSTSRMCFRLLKIATRTFKHPSANRMVMRLALELAGKSNDLPASSNTSRITIRLADGFSEALELVGKPYDLLASSDAIRLTIPLADGCSKGPRCVFSALDFVKMQRGPSEHPSASRITIRLALELADKPYDLPASSNASRITKRLADACSEDPCCIFNALNCVKLQRGPSEHTLASRITISLALELAGKPYDLLANSNASRFTIQLADGCSKGSHCVFNALDYVKLQRGPSEHQLASRITIRLALELAGKPYDLSVRSNARQLTIRLADGCSEGSRCILSALDCVKLQRGPSEHTSASRITIRLALELADKPYDLSPCSNASRLTIRFADGCLKGPRCIFSALNCVKLQCGPSEHSSASRITIRLALELAGKPYDLSANSNASRFTIRLADGCSKGPHCVFSALDCVKLQREPSEHSSSSRITIRLALKSSEHPSASHITIRLALEIAGKPYDLPTSSNASRITKWLADGCSKDPRCVFSALDCVKLQRGPYEHTSAIRITIRLVLEFTGKPYDLPITSNASRLTIRLADGCSKGPRCIFNALESTLRFSALHCIKLQRRPFELTSASRITIRLALEIGGKPYDLLASSNANRLTIQLADGCSEGPRCVFNALNCEKLQCGPSEHPLASRITIRFALELVGKSYDLRTSSNASRITKRLADGCSERPHCVFSALNCVKLQRGSFEHPSANRISIRLALELVNKPYDLPAISNANRLTIRLVDGCSKGPRCVFNALNYVKSQRRPSKHSSANHMTCWQALMQATLPNGLPMGARKVRVMFSVL
ncbi:hypothetical protein L7F22_002874 [Adiantum nelumboides]|nr:hypothetical protein [Adiantum nelumboides]